MLKTERIKGFQPGDQSLMAFVNLREGPGYFQRLNSGKMSLLVKHSKIFRKANSESTYNTNQDYHRFVKDEKYIIQLVDGSLTRAPGSANGWAKLFAEHKSAIKDFVREQKLIFQNQVHLIQLIRFCNQLLE